MRQANIERTRGCLERDVCIMWSLSVIMNMYLHRQKYEGDTTLCQDTGVASKEV